MSISKVTMVGPGHLILSIRRDQCINASMMINKFCLADLCYMCFIVSNVGIV